MCHYSLCWCGCESSVRISASLTTRGFQGRIGGDTMRHESVRHGGVEISDPIHRSLVFPLSCLRRLCSLELRAFTLAFISGLLPGDMFHHSILFGLTFTRPDLLKTSRVPMFKFFHAAFAAETTPRPLSQRKSDIYSMFSI